MSWVGTRVRLSIALSESGRIDLETTIRPLPLDATNKRPTRIDRVARILGAARIVEVREGRGGGEALDARADGHRDDALFQPFSGAL